MARFQMYPLQTNNVIHLYQWKDRINLDPPYQRLSIWDRQKQQTFIDSVMNGFDIPKLYFHETAPSSLSAIQYRYAVIDGKQRLLALWEFMSNRLQLSQEFSFFEDEGIKAGGATYDDLMAKFPRLRARFDSFDVPVTVVQTDEESFIEDLFARLNIQMPLSAPERRNALGGPLPYIIRKIGVCPFFAESVRITNKRLQHFDMAAKFLYLTRADALESTKREALDKFVTEFRRLCERGRPEASPEAIKALEAKTRSILDAMLGFFGRNDRLLASQGRTTLYFHIFRIHQRMRRVVPFTKQMLERFNEEVTAARKKSQRLSQGAQEELTPLEQTLVFFDREKQSPNDAGALKRQYRYMRVYFASVFKIQLPESD